MTVLRRMGGWIGKHKKENAIMTISGMQHGPAPLAATANNLKFRPEYEALNLCRLQAGSLGWQNRLCTIMAGLLLALAGCSQQTPVNGRTALEGQAPSATVEMKQVQVAFIGSGDAGSGMLHYRGQNYPFSVGGLGVGGIGVSTIEADGAVYHLSDITQFGGVYAQGRYGYAVGEASRGDLWLQNAAGVVMHLRAKREGLMLSLGGDGVVVAMNK